MCELIYSFVIGIASGIISSVIVTATYRKIDQEKERQHYFAEIRKYFSNLVNISSSDLPSFIDYLVCNEFPIHYKWIRLEKYEVETIQQLKSKKNEISEIVLNYCNDKSLLYEQGMNVQYINDNLVDKYIQKLSKLMNEISNMTEEILSLGNS